MHFHSVILSPVIRHTSSLYTLSTDDARCCIKCDLFTFCLCNRWKKENVITILKVIIIYNYTDCTLKYILAIFLLPCVPF